MVYIDLYEHVLDKDRAFNLSREEASIFIFIMLEGYSKLYDQKQNLIDHAKKNSYYMGYHDKGEYIVAFPAGTHKFLLLTLRPEWFILQAKNQPQYDSVMEHFRIKEKSNFALPDCSLTKAQLLLLKKMLLPALPSKDNQDQEITFTLALIKFINQYHKTLVAGNYTLDALDAMPCKKLASYIKVHYAENIVHNNKKILDSSLEIGRPVVIIINAVIKLF